MSACPDVSRKAKQEKWEQVYLIVKRIVERVTHRTAESRKLAMQLNVYELLNDTLKRCPQQHVVFKYYILMEHLTDKAKAQDKMKSYHRKQSKT